MATSTRRPLSRVWAEDELGVNSLYSEVKDIEQELEPMLHARRHVEADIRYSREEMDTYESELILREKNSNPDMSATAFERHIKLAIVADKNHSKMRNDLLDTQARLGKIEADIRMLELKLRGRTARLQELGGYLSYLAGVKNAAAVARQIADV